MITLEYLTIVLMVSFSLTAMITSMFEMMRTGFNLTLHVILQGLAMITAIATWLLMYLNFDVEMVQLGTQITFVLALLALLIWLINMFRGLMLFRCMHGSSFHSQVFAHQILFVIISFTAIFVF